MHNEVETNGTGSKVDVNLFLSSTFCLLVLLTAFIRLDSNWAPSHQEWPFLMRTILMFNLRWKN